MAKIEKEAGLRNGLKWMARIAREVGAYDPGLGYRLEAGEYGLRIIARRGDAEAETHLEYAYLADFTDGRNQAAFALTAVADKLEKR